MKLVGHVISHTHWDRAWYLPFEIYRQRLVRLMRKLLRIMESDPSYRFTMDGQTVPFEDHFEIHPADRARVERLVRSGRLLAGPFYVLPDQFLITGESLIRNLVIGIAQAKSLGGVQLEGALSDLFGHPSQIPQILNGFGIRSAFIARGMTREQLARGWFQRWRAADGRSEVLVSCPPGGYASLYYWGFDPVGDYPTPPVDAKTWSLDQAGRQLDKLLADYAAGRMTTRNLYLGNGVDHQEAQPHAGEIIRGLNRSQKRIRLVHSSFKGLFASVRREGRKLPIVRGPLDECGLVDTITSRVYLKQDYAEICGRLEMLTEPLLACADLFARGHRAWREPHHVGWTLNSGPNWAAFPEHPAREIEHLWKLLLRNAPHDDICGCSVDATHRDMENRFKRAREINEHFLHDAMLVTASRFAETLPDSDLPVLAVFNPHPVEFTGIVRADVFLKGVTDATSLRLVDSSGRAVEAAVESAEVVARPEWDGNGWRKEPARGAAVRLAVSRVLPPCSFTLLRFSPRRTDARIRPLSASARVLRGSAVVDDDHRRVTLRPDGTFDLVDKRLGRNFRGLGVLEDVEDVGEGYHTRRFAKPARAILSTGSRGRVRILSHNALATQVEAAFVFRLPARAIDNYTRRDSRTAAVPARILFDIPHDGGPVRETVAVDNCARDHHLRLRFATGLAAKEFSADAKFDWRTYPVGHRQARIDSCAVAEAGGAAFGVVCDCPNLVDSRTGRRGLDLGLSLLRAVDKVEGTVHRDVWVGQEGECLRTITRRLAWTSGSPQAVTRDCRVARRTLMAPPLVVALTPKAKHRYADARAETREVPEAPLVEIRGREIELSAWKQADDGRGWIVRVYSLAAKSQRATLSSALPVRRISTCSLGEGNSTPLRGTSFLIRSREIVTLRVEFK